MCIRLYVHLQWLMCTRIYTNAFNTHTHAYINHTYTLLSHVHINAHVYLLDVRNQQRHNERIPRGSYLAHQIIAQRA